MENVLPINLNINKSFSVKDNRNLNLEKTDAFKEKINKFSSKDKGSEDRDKDKITVNKNIKRYNHINKSIKNNNDNKTKDINKEKYANNKDDVENINNKCNNNEEANNIVNKADNNIEEDINVNDNLNLEIKDDNEKDNIEKALENLSALLQNINPQTVNDNSELNKIKESINKITENLNNNNVDLKEIQNLFKTLDESNIIPDNLKNEIMDDIKSSIQNELSKENLNFDEILNKIDNSNKNTENNKSDRAIKKDIHNKNIEIEEKNQNNIQNQSLKSIITTENNLNQSFQNKDEDLEKLEQNLLKITDKKNEEDKNITLDNSNINKLSQKIKVVTTNLKQSNNINPKELIDQIVQKSKLDISKGKSVMEIKLDPESLGKVTLKVVLERGLMTAKFTAENDKVKEILESKMDELKDSLVNQGINVQSLSVSVDGQDDLDRHKNILEAMSYNKKMSKNLSINGIDGIDEELQEIKENPYLTVDDNFNQLG